MSQYQIAVVVGSLRKDSFNKKLANAIVKLAPSEFSFKQLEISDLPHYNQDDDAQPATSVVQLKAEISAAQGLCLSRLNTIALSQAFSKMRLTMLLAPTGKTLGRANRPVF